MRSNRRKDVADIVASQNLEFQFLIAYDVVLTGKRGLGLTIEARMYRDREPE